MKEHVSVVQVVRSGFRAHMPSIITFMMMRLAQPKLIGPTSTMTSKMPMHSTIVVCMQDLQIIIKNLKSS
jgi:hypothetical protein